MSFIKPTVGRAVLFFADPGDTIPNEPGTPLAAIVARVWSDDTVNLTVFDCNGQPHGRTSVPLWQGDGPSPNKMRCEWMPYQTQKAKAGDHNSESAEPRPK